MATGFAVDDHGDVVIENNAISIVTGNELIRQKVWAVLKTNLREWFFDWDQGVDFDNLIGKGINEDLVRYEIEKGLVQVDKTFKITEFVYTVDKAARAATVTFKVQTDNGEEVGGEYTWA